MGEVSCQHLTRIRQAASRKKQISHYSGTQLPHALCHIALLPTQKTPGAPSRFHPLQRKLLASFSPVKHTLPFSSIQHPCPWWWEAAQSMHAHTLTLIRHFLCHYRITEWCMLEVHQRSTDPRPLLKQVCLGSVQTAFEYLQ